MTIELDQALLTGNVEDIDALLDEIDLDDDLGVLSGENDQDNHSTDNEMGVGEEDEALPSVIDTTQPKGDANLDKSEQGQEPKTNAAKDSIGVREIDGKLYIEVDPDNAAVASKDGKHTIPYAVLEKARNQASEASSRMQELEQQLSEATTAKEKLQLYTKQLEEAGITPEKLPEELLNDENALNALRDELPETAANLLTALVKRFQSKATTTQQEANDGVNEVTNALNADELTELRTWESSDRDRWDMALVIDNKLKNDPAFQAMPLKERFAEVQRRVKAAFGDPVQASIDAEKARKQAEQGQQQPQQTAEKQTVVPNSPSSLGGSSLDTTAAANQALLNQDALALEQSLANMSPEKVEEFLAQAVIAID
ncbi:TPA: hypothetical protein ACX3DB_002735 [Vibrio parahaemolyticus]